MDRTTGRLKARRGACMEPPARANNTRFAATTALALNQRSCEDRASHRRQLQSTGARRYEAYYSTPSENLHTQIIPKSAVSSTLPAAYLSRCHNPASSTSSLATFTWGQIAAMPPRQLRKLSFCRLIAQYTIFTSAVMPAISLAICQIQLATGIRIAPKTHPTLSVEIMNIDVPGRRQRERVRRKRALSAGSGIAMRRGRYEKNRISPGTAAPGVEQRQRSGARRAATTGERRVQERRWRAGRQRDIDPNAGWHGRGQHLGEGHAAGRSWDSHPRRRQLRAYVRRGWATL